MFPADLDHLVVEALIGGTWTDITSDVREAGDITITRGRDSSASRATSAQSRMWLDNRDGTYSNRNPSSPYYGQLGRNTQLRVRIAPLVDTDFDTSETTTSHVAPSVDLDGDEGLLICVWLVTDTSGPGTYNITVPGGFTAGTEVDETDSTSRSGRKVLSASGATGTATATTSATADVGMAASIALPGSITVQEVLQDASASGTVTLTTGAGTQAGWVLVAVQAWHEFGADKIPLPSGNGWMPLDYFFDLGDMRISMKVVDTAGAQAVEFYNKTELGDNHAHLFVLSGVTGLPSQVAYRFWGEIPEWPVRWDKSGKDVVVPIEANGILRRLDRAGAPLRSALFRAATSPTTLSALREYWPCEDGSRASQFASGLSGHKSLRYKGEAPTASEIEPFFGSAPVLQMGDTTKLIGTVLDYGHTGQVALRVLLETPNSGYADNARLIELYQASGSVYRWQIRYKTGGLLQVRALDADDAELENSGSITMGFDGTQTMLSLNLTQDGSDVDWELTGRSVVADGTVEEAGLSGTFTGQTLRRINKVAIGPAGAMGGTAVGHIMLGDSTTLADTLNDALVGHTGEAAPFRVARLCLEEGVTVNVTDDDYAAGAAMGPQGQDTLANLLYECRDADLGVLHEARNSFSVFYRPRVYLYNQTGPAFDYSASTIAAIEPQDNDEYVANDYTASRVDGTSDRRVLDDGSPLSISDPTDGGIGTYAREDSFNVETDGQVPSIAGWMLHLGTWDEPRYPLIGVNLASPAFTDSFALSVAAAALELGDYFSVDNLPEWMPPGAAEVLVQGSAERLFIRGWEIGFATAPAGPWFVFVVEDSVYGRLDTGGSELALHYDDNDTSLLVATDEGKALWLTTATRPQDFPFNISAGGEVMTVTAITGTTSPQTFTVTRSVNGVVKSHTAGTRLSLSRSVLGL